MDELEDMMQDDDLHELHAFTHETAAEVGADAHLDMDGEDDPPEADTGHD